MNAPVAACTASAWPLAPEQHGLWYLQHMNPGNGAYNLLFSCQARLAESTWPDLMGLLHGLMADFPLLRSAFVGAPAAEDGETAQQRVFEQVTADIREADCRELDTEALAERARADARLPFDLARPPLWRVHLYRQAEQQYLCVFVVHHVLLDFWSLGLLLQETAGRLSGAGSNLLTAQAAPYAEHASTRLTPQRQAELATWWREHLAEAPALHSLPLDYPRPGKQRYDGRSLAFDLGLASTERALELARSRQATPFMVMLAAYAAFLCHWSGETQVVLSTPFANRMKRGLRETLGQFVNSLCLKVEANPQSTFIDLLAQVKQVLSGALKHQALPLHQVVEAVAPPRDPSYTPISQLGFSWERLPVVEAFARFFTPTGDVSSSEQLLAGMALDSFGVPQQEGQLDLTLEMGGEGGEGFSGLFKYNDRLFAASSVATMRDAFVAMVARLLAEPARPMAEVQTAPAEQWRAWAQLGAGQVRNWDDRSILQPILRQVRSRGDTLALIDAEASFSYTQLWRRSSVLAAAMATHGIGPGERVGFKLERSAQLIPVILAIWRLGACYVPLDPHFPAERLAYIAADAGLGLVVTEPELDDFPAGLPRLYLKQLNFEADADDTWVDSNETGGAYLLYTSGSTGNPKGVQVGHPALLNLMASLERTLAIDSGSRLLAVTTPSFDISLLELFLPLCAGGQVVVADHASTRDGARLLQWIDTHHINLLQATPATWQMLLDSERDASLQGVLAGVTALCGGDILPAALAERVLGACVGLWNLYGPTETTIWSSAHRVRPGQAPTLGRPIANTSLWVLDEAGRPLPPGMLGELWIGGAGLAEGYWQRPELTAERFRDDLGELAPRLYRTGDKVRWNHRGELEHHGRLDFQVKLRGYRIELGEIESALEACEGVAQAAVDRMLDERGETLVAYWVARPGQAPSVAALQQSLRSRIPAYMVPSQWVELERFPLTPNNKVDRRRLPVPVYSLGEQNLVAPRNALEAQLLELFQQVLKQPVLGVHDDFFDAGGHSLLAVELVNKVARQQGCALEVGDLLDAPSVAALAARLHRGGGDNSLRVTLRKGQGRPVWLFHPIGGNVVSYRALARALHTDRPVIAIQSPGLRETGQAEVTVEAMASLYLEQIRQVQAQGPYLVGGWCFGGAIAYEVSRQLLVAGETLEGTFLLDTRAPVVENVPADADDSTLLAWFARDLATPHGVRLQLDPTQLRAMDSESAFAFVLTEAKQAGVLEPDADSEQLARLFETYLANGIALQLYFPPAIEAPLHLLLAANEPEDFGPLLGWEQLCPTGLQVASVPGDHNSILYLPQVETVAGHLDRCFFNQSLVEPSR
ncbi:non-ribosomal peptide synthetase [Phytopseudomonas dryadis]|uniref:Non-ribosomal peptide synthetase n=1 Tax=Phytopseudomonas dryadis TaxID=2487520 RepID=A0A4Q9R808_9GAMM|nr:non-ribosomal peptide synthetase [Pseudomonas dryadis]TBU96223.1 non-ribosomal peptide synthetase [Pseudomonas dryadis]